MDSFVLFLNDLFNHIAEIIFFLAMAIVSASLHHIRNWLKKREGRKFESGIIDSAKVRDLLSELRVLYDADRVGLWQFHNGEFFVSGTSIMKASMTHFVTKTGIASPPISQNLPTTHMVLSLKALQESLVCVFGRDTMPDDFFQDTLFATTGNNRVLCTAVRSANKNWIGILAIAWLDAPRGTQSTEQLVAYAKQVGEFIAHRS